MSAMDKVRRSREVDELGPQALGPQVEALTEQIQGLGHEVRRFMDELGEASERRALDWNESQEAAAAMWETTVAERIEPLAQSMVVLTNETRASIKQLHSNSEAQARAWSEAQSRSAAALKDSARAVHAAADDMGRTARGWSWTLWGGAFLVGMAPVLVLLIAFGLWLPLGWTLVPDAKGALYLMVREAPPGSETEPQTQ